MCWRLGCVGLVHICWGLALDSYARCPGTHICGMVLVWSVVPSVVVSFVLFRLNVVPAAYLVIPHGGVPQL